jgi:hypothetical protein
MRLRVVIAALLVGTTQVSFAQMPGAPQAKKPEAIREIAKLQALVGRWHVKEHWEPWEGMTAGGDGTGAQTIVAGPGTMSIVISYVAKTGPFPGYAAQGIVSWEADGRELPFHGAWSQSMTPGVSVESGKFEGTDLVMSYEVIERGTPYTVRNVYSNMKANSYKVTCEFIDRSGEIHKVLTLEYVRDRS